jgi:hypothetical protein
MLIGSASNCSSPKSYLQPLDGHCKMILENVLVVIEKIKHHVNIIFFLKNL